MTLVEVAVDTRDELGESPRWHAASQTLYWIDIPGHILHRYTPAENRLVDTPLADRSSALAFRRDGGLLLAVRNQVIRADASGNYLETLATTELLPDARFNDAAVDPQGRFWLGAFCHTRLQDNHLYCLSSAEEGLRAMAPGVETGNGIAWSPDGRIMYFADSNPRMIYAYDFDPDTGAVGPRRVFVHSSDQPGVPDGIAVDVEGTVWCAFWAGARVVRYSPTGSILQVIDVPTPRPTAPAFGGANLDHLYITSARDPENAALGGRVYVFQTDTRGLPVNETAL